MKLPHHFLSAACLFLVIMAVSAEANPPDFKVTAATSAETFTLTSAKGKFVVIHFLLMTECPVCLRHTADHLATTAKLPDTIQIFLKPDTDAEIRNWAENLKGPEAALLPIYRDPGAKLAGKFNIPDGYKFHGQTVHFPATVLLGPDGSELFRYVGKNNSDRLSPAALEARIKEFRKR